MAPPAEDRFAAVKAVADAVLYEGYVLYPYRASSQKNRLRWQFGLLAPPGVAGSERVAMRTECLLCPEAETELSLRLRFLHVQQRIVEATENGIDYEPVESLRIGDDLYCAFDEAVEEEIDIGPLGLKEPGLLARHQLSLPGSLQHETVFRADGQPIGRLERRRQPVSASLELRSERLDDDGKLLKISFTVRNTTDCKGPVGSHEELVRHSLVGVHTMLSAANGSFVSLLEPPPNAAAAAAACRNEGTYPVLVGAGDIVLSSPIILYDYPEVASESPGDLYDATEIDEILALRVLTLTDDEKAEARATDSRAAAVIDRCDTMPPEVWERLHGAMRSVGSFPGRTGSREGLEAASSPWWDPAADDAVDPASDSIRVAGVEVHRGSPVILRPSRRADAQDLFYGGLPATVTGVFSDVDGSRYVAVTLDDELTASELDWQGRYLFFHPDEIEPVVAKASRR